MGQVIDPSKTAFFGNSWRSELLIGVHAALIQAGMVLGVEAFLNRTGVGHAGFERNLIVTDSGAELLEKTLMLFW